MSTLVRPEALPRKHQEVDASYEDRVQRQRARVELYMRTMPADIRARIDAEQQKLATLERLVETTRPAAEGARQARLAAGIAGESQRIDQLDKAWSAARFEADEAVRQRDLQADVVRGVLDRYLDDRHAAEFARIEGGLAENAAAFRVALAKFDTPARLAATLFVKLQELVQRDQALATERSRMDPELPPSDLFRRLPSLPRIALQDPGALDTYLEHIQPLER